jgi:hypothetical protein
MVLKDRTFVPDRVTGTDSVVSLASLGIGLPSGAHTWESGIVNILTIVVDK